MDNIEELIELESKKYNLGAEQSAILLKRLVEKGRELNLTENTINSNIRRIGTITRFCTNPYGSLKLIVEAYEKEKERLRAQGIIGSLARTYESRRNSGEEDRFTTDEIETSIYVLTDISLRAT